MSTKISMVLKALFLVASAHARTLPPESAMLWPAVHAESNEPLIPAFAITDADNFEVRQRDYSAIGVNATRVAPVYIEYHSSWSSGLAAHCPEHTSGFELSPKQVGLFEAHVQAWRQIVALGKPALILEKDWSIGDKRPADVASKLAELMKKKEDWTLVGSCGDDHACSHAYILKPAAAALLVKAASTPGTRPCDLAARYCPLDWLMGDLAEYTLGTRIPGFSLYQVAGGTYPGHFGNGLIQQQRRQVFAQRTRHDVDCGTFVERYAQVFREASVLKWSL